jgi:predicted MFS family arabinose efflux permease
MNSGDGSVSKLFLPSLVLAGFATQPPETILSLLLIDIAESFNTTVGTMGQIRTTAAVLTLISAVSMGVLSIKMRHKTLLLAGLVCFIVSGIGCSLARDFSTMLATYSLSGIGLAMVSPMAFALIGRHVPLEKRANATGFFIAGNASSFMVGGPVLSYLTRIGGWRYAFLFYMLPIALAGAVLSWFGVPSEDSPPSSSGSGSYMDGVNTLLSNRSVLACLLGGLLAKATWQGVISYGVSFYRDRFQLSRGWASLVLSGIALAFIVGVLGSGRLINRLGRKTVTFYSFLSTGVFSVFYMNLPMFTVSVVVILVMSLMSGFRRNAGQSLSLEQVPRYRGSMMSLSTAGDSLGSALGAGLGGLILTTGGYWRVGLVLGLLGVFSSLIIRFYAVDPTAK